MTSSINNLVSVLTGANYLSWVPVMKGFLMAQGVSHVLTEDCPSPTTYDDNSNNANDIFSWKQDDTKALEYLILRVQESIRVKHDALISAKAFWDALSAEYGTQGVSATYGEFKAMLDTPIPSNQHPASAFNKINTHFTRLKKADFEIPIKVQAMILLSKLPSSMNSIAQIVAMDKELMTPTGIEKAAILCWEQADNSRGKHKEVQKLSAVKRKQPDPKFNQQQQHQQQPPKQGGGNNAGAPAQNKGKNKRCGTRGGKNRHQNNHDHAHLASTVDFAAPTMVDTLSVIDPRRLAHTPGAQFFGPPAWDNTQKAFDLTHVLGVEPSFETIRALDKIAASSITPSFEVEPAPKRLCLEDRLSAAVPTYDDDTVSLGSDYIEDDIYNMYIDDQANEGENVVEYQWQVPFSSPQKQYAYFSAGACFNAHVRIAMSSISVEPCPNENCVHLISFSACARCKGKRPDQSSLIWMLDSGASEHFTMSLDDFSEYSPFETKMIAYTTNGVAAIEGKGTVIIRYKDEQEYAVVARLHPILYMPQLTHRLLSMGSFLRDKLTVRGNSQHITIYTESGNPYLIFYPRISGDTIYILESYSWKEKLKTSINPVDYELMHQRFAHPSKEVLRHA
jgi:hypothetical protein